MRNRPQMIEIIGEETVKRRICNWIILFAMVTGVLSTSVICHAEEITDKSDMIAGEDERASSTPVGTEGMVPIYGTDVKDGTYPIEVESSSSMFRIVKAELTVKDGDMTAVITLSGKGYLKLYMGTGEQAVDAKETDYAAFIEDAEGAYTYTVSVEALDQELECTGFSKRKEKWYDHQILFRADSLPQEAFLKQLAPALIDVEDGTYSMEVELAGGSGKAAIVSPAPVTVSDKTGVASIQWSSPNYDYMIVNQETYFPVNTEGNSVFEIPVWVLDEEMAVIADTTAMGMPHEIEYTLTFHSDTLKAERSSLTGVIAVIVLAVCVIAAGAFLWIRRKKKGANE